MKEYLYQVCYKAFLCPTKQHYGLRTTFQEESNAN